MLCGCKKKWGLEKLFWKHKWCKEAIKLGWNRLLVAFTGLEVLPEDLVLALVEYAQRAIQVLKEVISF